MSNQLWMVTVAGCLAFCTCFAGCENKETAKSPTSAQAVESAQTNDSVEPKVLPDPPGPPGPFLIRMESGFPNHIFGAAATENSIAVAMQGDARDVSLCPGTGLPVCFRGQLMVSARMNPNQPVIVNLYESDTQSGAQIDDLVAVGDLFAVALNEGIYVGDSQKVSLVFVDAQGNTDRALDLNHPESHIVQTALSPYANDSLLICRIIDPDAQRDKMTARILCESYQPRSSKRTTVATLQSDIPIRAMDVAYYGERALVAWNEGGHMKAAFLDKMNEAVDLGLATAMPIHIAAGLNEFAIAWQGDDGYLRVDRIPYLGNERQTLKLNGVQYRSVNGMVAVSEGYLLAFRHQNTQQIALISTDFKQWHLVENSQNWRMFSGYASLDIQDAHTGRMVWQTAESLVSQK